MSITRNAIAALYSLEPIERPVVQVLDIKPIAQASGAGQVERYKLKISDGLNFMQAMLTTQHNHLVQDGVMTPYCLLRLDEHICNDVQDRRICIILNASVVAGAMPSGAVGNPTSIEGGAAAAAAPHPTSFGAPRGSIAPTSRDARMTVPVATLNPYSNKWTIQVRVTSKGQKRTWSNARGEGQLFGIELLDQHGTQIRATFFRDAVDKFYDLIQEAKVYYMSGGKLKMANRRYTSIPHQYEITFDARATIELAPDDSKIEKMSYTFVTLDALPSTDPNSIIDVVGVVKDVGTLTNLTSRAGKELTKRDLTLVDESLTSVTCTLWAERAAGVDDSMLDTVVAIKGVRVGDYGGRSLSTLNSSHIEMNPDVPEAHKMTAWWSSAGRDAAVTSISNSVGGAIGGSSGMGNVAARKTFADIRAEGMGRGEKPDIITVKGTVSFIKSESDRPPWYPACNSTAGDCNKKAVTDMTGEGWRCEKCDQSFEQPRYRYILSITAVDDSGHSWLTLFNEQAEKLLDGKTADELQTLKEDSSDEATARWAAIFQRANFRTHLFRVKVKNENVNGDDRLRSSVIGMKPIDYSKENKVLLDAISSYDKMV